jgi:uroporphyrinogen-III synthase
LTSAARISGETSAPVAVVTRQAPDHRGLTRRLDARNVRWVHAPAFELREFADAPARARALHSCDLVLVTSPATARIAVEHVAPSMVQNARWIAPGEGTASILRESGIDARTPASGGTSEDVLAMPEMNDVAGRTVAIVGAPGGRETIGRELRRRGAAAVRRVHFYERLPLQAAPALLDLLERRIPAIVLASSVLVIEHLFSSIPDQLRPALSECGFVVSSARTEAACQRQGVRRLERAPGAGAEAMVEVLERFQSRDS